MEGMSKAIRPHKISFHSGRTVSRPLIMSPPETTPHLPTIENGTDQSEPSWFESYKWFLFSSYFNVLLIFVPLSALAHHLNWDVSLRFGFSFFAIVPLAKVLTLLPANDGTALTIFVSVFSFWVMLLSKCQQNLERRLLVYSMHLLETRSKSLSALRPCSEVRITSSYAWTCLLHYLFQMNYVSCKPL